MKIRTRTAKEGALSQPPQWALGYLEAAAKEARKFLSEEQYSHAVHLFEEMSYDDDPTKSETQDIRKIGNFYELRDKGGILEKINLRIYFTIIEEIKLILILAAHKKEEDGQVPKHIRIKVRNRLRIAKGQMAEK